jgi:hypothetical protein
MADRLITIPRGGKIPYGTVRGEYMFEPSRTGSFYGFFGFGLTTFFDAEVVSDQLQGEEHFTSLDIAFNLNAPLSGLAPGISVGMLDAADQSPQGRRFYAAVSIQDSGSSGPFSGNAAVETTIGIETGTTLRGFVGVSLPVSEKLRFLAEVHNGLISAGAELKTEKGPFFRLVFRSTQTLLSVGSSVHF